MEIRPDSIASQPHTNATGADLAMSPPGKTRVRDALVGALVLLIGGVAAGVGAYVNDYLSFHKPSAQEKRALETSSTAPTTTVTITVSEVKIAIAAPDGPVPRCASITGTVTVPDGLAVWVAQQAQGDSVFYALTKVRVDAAGQWEWRETLGDPEQTGMSFKFFAFALDDQTSRLLERIKAAAVPEKDYAYWYVEGELPNAVGEIATQRFVRNDHDVRDCS